LILELRNRVALITGSSRGIGKAIASRLANEGANIVINAAKSVREAETTLSELPRINGQKHCFVQADVMVPEQIAGMMIQIKQQYGYLDVLVNNAGITSFVEHSKLDELTIDIFDGIYKTHLRGAFLCIQKALPLLRESKKPSIINIASVAAITAIGSNIAYCAMKAALVNITKSLARALSPDIRVNAISPGLTETDLIKGWGNYTNEQVQKTPLGRLATCEDIANAVFALLTSLTYVTGQNIVVDGGRILV